MGLAKRQMEEEHERGWRSIDKLICADCVHEPALKLVVEENATAEGPCSYCGREGTDELAVCDTDAVTEVIGDSLHTEFNQPIEEQFWDDGEYVGENCDTFELLLRLGEDIGTDQFEQDVVEAFGDLRWCQRDYYGTKEDEALSFSWQRFAEVVKYERRYLFLTLNQPDEYAEAYDVTPAQMLTKIGELVDRHDLIQPIPEGTDVLRGRPHEADTELTTATALGTPPRDHAVSNRMSGAGIAVFYGAYDRETTLAEIAPSVSDDKPVVTLGTFRTRSELRVIDLASLPEIPSIFNDDERGERRALRFLSEFTDIVSRPAGDSRAPDREIVDYIPTQVVTEYFWHAFGEEYERGRIDGILYRSARQAGGICCALFIPEKNCLEAGTDAAVEDAPAANLVSRERVENPPRSPESS